LLGTVLTTSAVGYYEVSLKLTAPATFVTTAIAGALMPKLSNLHSRGEEVSTDVTNALGYNSILAIPLFFGALPLAHPLVVTIYGSEYSPAAPFLIGLALYRVLSTQRAIYHRTLNGIDRPDLGLRADALTLVFNIVVGVGLISLVGAIGVVVATILSEAIRLIVAFRYVRQQISGISHLPRPLLEQFGSGLVMSGVVAGLAHSLSVTSVFVLLGIVGAGAGVYGGVLAVVSSHFRSTVRSLYRQVRERA
jgi:O-antigen/teichoic acid export membrane protein